MEAAYAVHALADGPGGGRPWIANAGDPSTPGPRVRSGAAPDDPAREAWMPAVLYVDDELAIQRAVRLWLERYGVTVHTAASVHAAREVLAEHVVDGVFIDVWLEDGSGVALYDWLRAARPALAEHVAFVSGDPNAPLTRDQLAATGCPVLAKPFDLDALRAMAAGWVR